MMTLNHRHAVIPGPIGEVTLVASEETLIGVYFPGHWTKPNARDFGPRVPAASDPLLSSTEHQLREYLDGRRDAFDLPTRTSGDAFQEQVWSLVKPIPYGTTITYGEIAKMLGDAALARDVGQAVGHNPLAMVVPCHRVV